MPVSENELEDARLIAIVATIFAITTIILAIIYQRLREKASEGR
jgi:preprotein translocase subunit SecG